MSRSSSFIDAFLGMALDGDGDLPLRVIVLGIDGVEIVPDLLLGTVETGHLGHDAAIEEQLPTSLPLTSDDEDRIAARVQLTGYETRGIHPPDPLT